MMSTKIMKHALGGILIIKIFLLYFYMHQDSLKEKEYTVENKIHFLSHREQTTEDYEEKWQAVTGTRDRFYVFSAYYDDRTEKMIRIIAATQTFLAEKVACKLFYGENRGIQIVNATNHLIRGNFSYKYSAYFILCPLKHDITVLPLEVSIIKPGVNEDSNRLRIHNNKNDILELQNLAVCVKPMYDNYNKVFNFVEFIEFYRLMGASHFYFYNHSIVKSMSDAINYYRKEGVVSLLPWQLNITSNIEIRNEGQFAANNDCIYRTMYRYRYVLLIDLDEFIVPYKNINLLSMLNNGTVPLSNSTGAYSFINVFFYLPWPDDQISRVLDVPLVSLRKTRRDIIYNTNKNRFKCIVLPEKIVEMANHYVWEFMFSMQMEYVSPDVAYMHHYRNCELGYSDCIHSLSKVERRMYTWKNEMILAVRNRLSSIKDFIYK